MHMIKLVHNVQHSALSRSGPEGSLVILRVTTGSFLKHPVLKYAASQISQEDFVSGEERCPRPRRVSMPISKFAHGVDKRKYHNVATRSPAIRCQPHIDPISRGKQASLSAGGPPELSWSCLQVQRDAASKNGLLSCVLPYVRESKAQGVQFATTSHNSFLCA
ncbi:hypothetical protein PLICRDRAFT_44816 [Plicaturopsis crispa FD-325 SS-3]|nr:hypothetical protein PLICRDRAFT_44816 [Plicaturopsis crispa FD-325 SS-3]